MHSSPRLDFQLLFESLPGLNLVLSPDLVILAASDSYLNATMTRRDAILGRNLFEVFPDNPDDPTATGVSNLRASLDLVLKTGTAHTMAIQQYDIRKPDGSFEKKFWSPLNKPVFNAEKEICYIIHRVEDVTEFVQVKKEEDKQVKITAGLREQVQKMEAEIYARARDVQESNQKILEEISEREKLEKQLKRFNEELEEQVTIKTSELSAIVEKVKESEAKYKTIFLKSPLPKWIYDYETFRFLEVNEEAILHYGYTEEEFLQMTIKDIRPKEDLEKLLDDHKNVPLGATTRHGYWRHLKKNGEVITVETTAHAMDYNNRKARMVVINDITDKLKAEERLAAERNLLRVLIDNLPVYIYVKDTSSRYIVANRAFVDLVGAASEQDTIGKNVLDLFGPEIADENFDEDKRVFTLGESILNREESIVDGNGNRVWLLTSKVPLKDEDKNITGLIGISRDITERKYTDTLLKQLNRDLEKRAIELQSSNTELERFAYVASHDLQEPLRMVSSFLGLLEKKLGGQLDDDGRQYLHFAVDGAERMKKLIQDLLEYSRVGISAEKISEVDCNEVLGSVRNLFHLLIEEKNAILDIKPLPIIQGVKAQVHQLFQNLVGNALKYAGEDPSRVEIGFSEQDSAWQFYVRDNGIGIESRHFDKIFIIFQRLHHKKEYSGTGIGLAICKKIVEKHHGKIWLESTPGKGTVFYIELPK